MDVARREGVEAELNRLIERQSTRETDPDEQEELWKASVRAHNSRRREELRAAWCEYHEGQAARHRAVLEFLVRHHEGEAAKLIEVEPKGASESA